jgi:hypothetical protein
MDKTLEEPPTIIDNSNFQAMKIKLKKLQKQKLYANSQAS